MKKPKFMLTAIGVLAIIGGALAFRANHLGLTNYCYTFTTATLVSCTRVAFFRTVAPLGGGTMTIIKYTATVNTNLCTLGPTCTRIGRYATTF